MSDETPVEVTDHPERHRYEATIGGELAGVIVYERSEGAIDLQHTIVEDEFEGHGVGSTLARVALEAARAAGERVIPTCPFVAAFLERHPEYADVVA